MWCIVDPRCFLVFLSVIAVLVTARLPLPRSIQRLPTASPTIVASQAGLSYSPASPTKDFIPEDVLHRRLPWSVKLLLKAFWKPHESKTSSNKKAATTPEQSKLSRVKLLFPFLDHPWIKPVLQRLSPLGKVIIHWIADNKTRFILGAKLFVGLYVGMAILRRIIHWYTGVTEYELLLDQHDYDYQTYGVHMDGFGSWILSRIDKVEMENFGYRDTFYRVDAAMNKPCFPYAMNTYALHMGHELADVVSDIDVRVRAMRKRYQRALKDVSQAKHRRPSNLGGRRSGDSSSYRLDVRAVQEVAQSLHKESDIALLLQKALLILSARQADAYLRTTRMLILSEANNCEDLLKTWRQKVVKKSQTLRIPFFQNALAKIIGFTTGTRLKNLNKYSATSVNSRNLANGSRGNSSSSIPNDETSSKSSDSGVNGNDDYSTNILVKDLNAKEKVVLLENILKNLYIVAGRIQRHLESLASHTAVLIEPSDAILQDELVWHGLESWISQTSTLTLEAVHALSFQPAVLAARSASFSSYTSNAAANDGGASIRSSGEINGSGVRVNGRGLSSNTIYAQGEYLQRRIDQQQQNVRIFQQPSQRTSMQSITSQSQGGRNSPLLTQSSSTKMLPTSSQPPIQQHPIGEMSSSRTQDILSTPKRSQSPLAIATRTPPRTEFLKPSFSSSSMTSATTATKTTRFHGRSFVAPEILSLLCLMTTSTYEAFTQTAAPVLEFVLPLSPLELVEHGVVRGRVWRQAIRQAGGEIIDTFPWESIQRPLSDLAAVMQQSDRIAPLSEVDPGKSQPSINKNGYGKNSGGMGDWQSRKKRMAASVMAGGASRQPPALPPTPSDVSSLSSSQGEKWSRFWLREILYMQRAPGSFAGRWSQAQSMIQVINIAPAYHYIHPEYTGAADNESSTAQHDIQLSMVNFEDFAHVSSQLMAYNATTRWTFTAISSAEAARFSSSSKASDTGFRQSTSSSSGSKRPSSTSHSKAQSQTTSNSETLSWTKVTVTLDMQMRSSLYRYFVASVVKTETQALVEAWRRAMEREVRILLRDPNNSAASQSKDIAQRSHEAEDDAEEEEEDAWERSAISAVGSLDSDPADSSASFSLSTNGGTGEDSSSSAQRASATSQALRALVVQQSEEEVLQLLQEQVFLHLFSRAQQQQQQQQQQQPHSTVATTSSVNTESNADGSATSNINSIGSIHNKNYDDRASSTTSSSMSSVKPTHSTFSSQGRSTHTLKSDFSAAAAAASRLTAFEDVLTQHERQLLSLRHHWQTSGVILKDLTRVSSTFANHLQTMGLRKRTRQGIYAVLRVRVIVSLAFWTSLAVAGFELNKRSEDISWGMDFLWKNSRGFIERRITTPTVSILNDVILNKKMKITDPAALVDAKRSLRSMLYDFLLQNNPNMGESERQKLAANMDMSPISEEYEQQLKHPMRNIVSGRIARLVLIQLQFVKKELLVAMQAIDELFNANQVNLQLLAVTPAILAIVALQVLARLVTSAVKAASRAGGSSSSMMMESAAAVSRDVKNAIREMERLLVNSAAYHQQHPPVSVQYSHATMHPSNDPNQQTTGGGVDATTATTASMPTLSLAQNYYPSSAASGGSSYPHLNQPYSQPYHPAQQQQQLTSKEWGELLSLLYRVHLLLMIHSGNFDALSLQQLQEDLRDIAQPQLTVQQRLSVLERIHRQYTFLHSPRRLFGAGFMQ